MLFKITWVEVEELTSALKWCSARLYLQLFVGALINVIYVCLCIVMSIVLCFLFCLSSFCVPYVASFSGLSIFDCPFGILQHLSEIVKPDIGYKGAWGGDIDVCLIATCKKYRAKIQYLAINVNTILYWNNFKQMVCIKANFIPILKKIL
jgi:hypothetical protein